LLDIPAGIPYIELHKVVGIGFRNNPEEFLFGPGVFSKLTIGRLSEPNKIKAIEMVTEGAGKILLAAISTFKNSSAEAPHQFVFYENGIMQKYCILKYETNDYAMTRGARAAAASLAAEDEARRAAMRRLGRFRKDEQIAAEAAAKLAAAAATAPETGRAAATAAAANAAAAAVRARALRAAEEEKAGVNIFHPIGNVAKPINVALIGGRRQKKHKFTYKKQHKQKRRQSHRRHR
jgi:hypothetical protein